MPINENMLRFMVRNEFQPRTKNGQPDHRITGEPSTTSIQSEVRSPKNSRSSG